MVPTVRLFGPGRDEIFDLDGWFQHAPPEGGLAQWRDGYSAKELARSWTRPGRPAVPDEFWVAVRDLAGDRDELYGRPEHTTALDAYGRGRQHDLFACVRRDGATVLVIGVEAKACETFDGRVADRAVAAAPSNKRARCNLLSRALFGRPVMDEDTGEIIDTSLGAHGYQLWTAAVGTVIEAQQRGVDRAVLVIQRFRPRDLASPEVGDTRDWASALDASTRALTAFMDDLVTSGSRSHETEFVKAGTGLSVIEVESPIGS
jgi:hypothetical protein